MCAQSPDKTVMHIGGEDVEVDPCLVPLVRTLNDNGYATLSCCCGHGEWHGVIKLEDQYLVLVKNRRDAINMRQAVPTQDL